MRSGFIKIDMHEQNARELLKLSGYKTHKDESFIRSINHEKRFHVKVLQKYIELHQDYTVGGYHRVPSKNKVLKREAMRIRQARRMLKLKSEEEKKTKVLSCQESPTQNMAPLQTHHTPSLRTYMLHVWQKWFGR